MELVQETMGDNNHCLVMFFIGSKFLGWKGNINKVVGNIESNLPFIF